MSTAGLLLIANNFGNSSMTNKRNGHTLCFTPTEKYPHPDTVKDKNKLWNDCTVMMLFKSTFKHLTVFIAEMHAYQCKVREILQSRFEIVCVSSRKRRIQSEFSL